MKRKHDTLFFAGPCTGGSSWNRLNAKKGPETLNKIKEKQQLFWDLWEAFQTLFCEKQFSKYLVYAFARGMLKACGVRLWQQLGHLPNRVALRAPLNKHVVHITTQRKTKHNCKSAKSKLMAVKPSQAQPQPSYDRFFVKIIFILTTATKLAR